MTTDTLTDRITLAESTVRVPNTSDGGPTVRVPNTSDSGPIALTGSRQKPSKLDLLVLLPDSSDDYLRLHPDAFEPDETQVTDSFKRPFPFRGKGLPLSQLEPATAAPTPTLSATAYLEPRTPMDAMMTDPVAQPTPTDPTVNTQPPEGDSSAKLPELNPVIASSVAAPNKAPPMRLQLNAMKPSATVTLHTDQAARIWQGGDAKRMRYKLIGQRTTRAPSLMQTFSQLQNVFNATGNDNPFADAALLRLEDMATDIRAACEVRVANAAALLAERAESGVETPLIASSTPHHFAVEFGTPYHYVLCDLIALWDNTVHHLLTVSVTGLLPANAVRGVVNDLQRVMLEGLHHFSRDAYALRRFSGYEVSRQAIKENRPEAIAFQTQWNTQGHTRITADVLRRERQPIHVRPKGWKPRK